MLVCYIYNLYFLFNNIPGHIESKKIYKILKMRLEDYIILIQILFYLIISSLSPRIYGIQSIYLFIKT